MTDAATEQPREWPNNFIRMWLMNCHTPHGHFKHDLNYISVHEAESLAATIRDDMQARIAALEAQLKEFEGEL